MLPLRPFLTQWQCTYINIYFPTQQLDTCKAPSSPPNTKLSSISYTSATPQFHSSSQNASPTVLKQRTYLDLHSAHCLPAYMQLKTADGELGKMEGPVWNNDQRALGFRPAKRTPGRGRKRRRIVCHPHREPPIPHLNTLATNIPLSLSLRLTNLPGTSASRARTHSRLGLPANGYRSRMSVCWWKAVDKTVVGDAGRAKAFGYVLAG